MSNEASRGRLSARVLALVLGLALVATLGIGAVTVGAGAQGEPPERLTEAELLSRVTAAPEDAPPFRATVAVEHTVVPEGLIGASEGGDTGDSGPRTARIWRGGPEQLRAELQGENGDKVVVKNGAEVSVYDGASNTLKVGEKPEAEGPPEAGPSPEEIDEFLAEISPTSNLTTGAPVEVAGRWTYPLTLEPKDKSLTLIERAEVLVDAEAFVPLRFELYAEETPEPVARYEAQDFEVGPVPDRRFEFETPPGATVEQIEPPDRERADEGRRGSGRAAAAGDPGRERRSRPYLRLGLGHRGPRREGGRRRSPRTPAGNGRRSGRRPAVPDGRPWRGGRGTRGRDAGGDGALVEFGGGVVHARWERAGRRARGGGPYPRPLEGAWRSPAPRSWRSGGSPRGLGNSSRSRT